jgi:membrane-bound lytic murein transglycosylase D
MATGYDDLRMPAETKNYVPRLQAIKNILRDPQLVAQMNLPVLPNRPYFESVALYGKHIDLDTVAKLANISVDEVKALNPEHSRPVMKVETINLPKDRVSQFKSNLNAYQESEKPLSRWGSYTVQPGEKAERIAGKFNMSLSQLQEANGVSMKSLSKPGQPLLVLSNPAAEQTPGTASLTSLNENTPVNVAETPDKPASKAIPAHADAVSTKTKASTAKEVKSSKTQKSNKSEKSDKTPKTTKPEKSAAKTTSASSSKPAAKTATGSKPATKPTGTQKK